MNDGRLTVGIIGLGAMGEPMARNLLQTRGSLNYFSRSPKPELEAAGGSRANSLGELAETSDVIISMLPDLPELEELLYIQDGLLSRDSSFLLLIGSTSSPTGVRELAQTLKSRTAGKVHVVDSPVSGGVEGAQNGTLSIMLGGTEANCAIAEQVLAPCGEPTRLGPLGAGQVAKACNQMVVAATILALGEATVLADRSGIDLQKLWDLLGGGYAASRVLEVKKAKLVTGDDEPNGIARYMVKDLRFASDVADATGTETALLPCLQSSFNEILDAGLGERDITVTRRFIEERSQTK